MIKRLNDVEVLLRTNNGAAVILQQSPDMFTPTPCVRINPASCGGTPRKDMNFSAGPLRTLSKALLEAADKLEAGTLFKDPLKQITVDGVNYIEKEDK